ncbi:eCIS core domain-containing protein [Streptomyces jumonjinensis]
MYAHERPAKAVRPGPSARAAGRAGSASRPGPGPLTPARLMELQRALGNTAVARMVEEEAGHSAAGPEHRQPVQRATAHTVLRSPGRPLDDGVRAEMETRLGSDFSDVRVHDDSAARASAVEVGARAYTSGNHVVIGPGGADPHTLAHELTHVIQQREGPVAGTDHGDGLKLSDPSDRFEREAEANARRAMAARPQSASADARSGSRTI